MLKADVKADVIALFVDINQIRFKTLLNLFNFVVIDVVEP